MSYESMITLANSKYSAIANFSNLLDMGGMFTPVEEAQFVLTLIGAVSNVVEEDGYRAGVIVRDSRGCKYPHKLYAWDNQYSVWSGHVCPLHAITLTSSDQPITRTGLISIVDAHRLRGTITPILGTAIRFSVLPVLMVTIGTNVEYENIAYTQIT